MDFNIIPECYLDTNLVTTLVPPSNKKTFYNHAKGCPSVVKKMLEEKALKDGFALGIIDKDKKELNYLKEFDEIIEKNQLKLFKHPQKHHYFIQIMPALEKWLLKNAQEVNVNLEDFKLPNDFDTLKTHSKKLVSKEDLRFKTLFLELKNRKASGFMTLTDWVSYLKNQNYQVDLSYFE